MNLCWPLCKQIRGLINLEWDSGSNSSFLVRPEFTSHAFILCLPMIKPHTSVVWIQEDPMAV